MVIRITGLLELRLGPSRDGTSLVGRKGHFYRLITDFGRSSFVTFKKNIGDPNRPNKISKKKILNLNEDDGYHVC